ncbi:hypothetical protein LY54_03315 [Salegentibacter mishustinae]|nr:hypothetical protein LY54_03315 [Salegentibacter mishustinae]
MFPKLKREDFLRKNHMNFLEMELKAYERYIAFTEDYLDKAVLDYQLKHKDALEEDTLDRKAAEEYRKKMFEVDGNFTQRFRESIIVQLFSFFEKAILNSCEMYYFNKELDEGHQEGMNTKAGFEEAKAFLKKEVRLTLNELNPELDFFSKLSTLRNKIVHHQLGNLSDDRKKINDIRALSKNRFIIQKKRDFLTSYFIHFDKPEFSFEIIDKIKLFYRKLEEKGVYYL